MLGTSTLNPSSWAFFVSLLNAERERERERGGQESPIWHGNECYTTWFEVEESVFKMSGQLRSIVVYHPLEELRVLCLCFSQIVDGLQRMEREGRRRGRERGS